MQFRSLAQSPAHWSSKRMGPTISHCYHHSSDVCTGFGGQNNSCPSLEKVNMKSFIVNQLYARHRRDDFYMSSHSFQVLRGMWSPRTQIWKQVLGSEAVSRLDQF